MNLIKLTQQTMLLGLLVTASAGYAADPDWTYNEQTEWGALPSTDAALPIPKLYPFAECGVGLNQSPINIPLPSEKAHVNGIKAVYSEAPLSLTDTGHTIKANIPAGSKNTLFIGREKYELLQFHFHAPSEHKINGRALPLEIHFVHATDSGRLAVLAVFVETGGENREFQNILDYAPSYPGETVTADAVILPRHLLPYDQEDFYTYAGSLTTPPCSEGVDWYVLRKPIHISSDQLAQFKTLYFDNNRATQELNGRKVETLKMQGNY